jgi:23S rRNA (uracil1939-C5)-methyltransferase
LRKKKINFPILESVEIGPAVSEGNCIAKVDNRAIFIKYAAPGDVVDLQIIKKKKNYLEAKIVKFHSRSAQRIEPFCAHFATCGGCKWQHLSYAQQLAFKQQQVVDAMERIGGLTGFNVMPIRGCDNTTGYRNKMDFTFSNRAWIENFNRENPENINALGFHIPGRFDKVLDLEECHLATMAVNKIRLGVKTFCEENGYEFYDILLQTGFVRNLIIRNNRRGEYMVLLSFFYNDAQRINKLMQHICDTYSMVTSLVYVINDKKNDTITDLDIKLFYGNDHLVETLGGLNFKIRPQSFFQTNSQQAEILYNITREFAGLTGQELVYDLYTGTGSIALFLAENAKKVIGIEYVPEAIMDAKENMISNGIFNAEFYAGDMKQILTAEFIAEHGRPDVVITDPPRDGMHPDVLQRLLEMETKRIVYVSCNPATQARDAKILAEKYVLIKIQPVDMFPHTHHVENVGLWELK